MSSVKEWVQKYIDLGMSPLPILPRAKAPKDEAWQKLTYGPSDFDPDSNVGIHLGNGWVDVDLDSPEARALAPIFLPPTIVFGRPGSLHAHWIYRVKGKLESLKWNGIGGSDDCICELRGWSPGANAPAQTVFPPSIHKGTGELIMWADTDDPAQLAQASDVDEAYIIERVKMLAIACMLARHSPGPGARHEFRMAMAGFLYRCGLDEKQVMLIGRAVTKYTGGSEEDWNTTGRGTIAKLKADPKAVVSGAGVLKERMVDGDKALRVLNKYLGRMEQAAKDEVIDELNAKYAVVTIGGTCCVMDYSRPDGLTFFTHDNFRKTLAKRTLPAFQQKNGKWKSGEPIADFWLKHPDGRHYNRLVYAPPPVQAEPKDYNGWRGFKISPREGDWLLIRQHIEHVMCRDQEHVFEWVINWCASLLQKPGQVAGSSIVLKGLQGAGKGFFAEDLLGQMFDTRHFIKMSSPEQFYGRFAGEIISGRCLIFLDEATWGGDKRDRGILKDRVTSHSILVDRKGIAASHEPSMIHLIIASNEDWIVGLDGDDRRFVVLEHDPAFAQNKDWFDPLYDQLRNGGREAFLHDMLNWRVDEDLLRRPPRTRAKDRMKQLSLPPVYSWLLDRLHEGSLGSNGWPKEIQAKALYELYVEWANKTRNRIISAVDFGRKISPILGKSSPKHKQGRVVEPPPLDEARELWDKFVKSETEWEDVETKSIIPF